MRNFLIGGLILGALAGCSPGTARRTLTIKGSDTMVILGQRWAETYMHKNAGITLQVTGGGSGTGIAALINGSTDICQASRPMSPKEREQAKAKRGHEVREFPVALDGIAVYVHPSNPMPSITMAKLAQTFKGGIRNWKDLGGEDARIILYSRENSSGTYDFFREHVLEKKDFADDAQYLPGTATIVNSVSKDPKSIGYGGIGYGGQGVRAVPLKKDDASPPVEPSLANVQGGTYPLARELYFYTIGEPAPELKAFIDWVRTPEGQEVCEKVGYYPLRKN